ncbi:MAG: DALR anticodon-binding domain-containing protein, partial [Acidobacteriota bacterium]
RESDILHLKFWARAFEMLKQAGAVSHPSEGQNAGCWVMDLSGDERLDDLDQSQKVLVRSSGTVTYTGKDIAYQLWKFGLLQKDFHYCRLLEEDDGHTVWRTTSEQGDPDAPSFGHAQVVYNVIDQRQAFPQKVVARGLAALGFREQAERSRHFAYEMVALTPDCAREMGMELDAARSQRGYVEMSGRKGLGVKADDLLDRLEGRAALEVRKRNPDPGQQEIGAIAHLLAVGALRYFMLRFTRNRVIAFDFNEVLSFEGETGPYVQYSAVRAGKIMAKLTRTEPLATEKIAGQASDWLADPKTEPPAAEWRLARACGQVGTVVAECVEKQDLSGLARHAFSMAQIFNSFYHRFPVIQETDEAVRRRRILLVDLFRRTMTRTLDLMGIPVPPRM